MNEKINLDFLDAIARIESGEVRHPILRSKKAQGKQLKLNASNVALESGHSRTLIAMDDSDYPDIRARVKPRTGYGDEPASHPDLKRRGESTQQQIARLLTEKSNQELLNRILSTRLAQAAHQIHLLEKKTKASDEHPDAKH